LASSDLVVSPQSCVTSAGSRSDISLFSDFSALRLEGSVSGNIQRHARLLTIGITKTISLATNMSRISRNVIFRARVLAKASCVCRRIKSTIALGCRDGRRRRTAIVVGFALITDRRRTIDTSKGGDAAMRGVGVVIPQILSSGNSLGEIHAETFGVGNSIRDAC